MITQFEAYKKKEKFIQDNALFYPGILNESLKPLLTEKINLIADDFEKLVSTGNASTKEYQGAIKSGLERFNGIDLDTEDRERVCHYVEELMDIVGLESSDGSLNDFMYGFDPNKASK